MFFMIQVTTCPVPLWNSLEVTKLIVSALTPVAVALLGLWLSQYLKRVEHLQWANQKAIEKRLQVYSDLAPVLNDLYCYFDYIGDWKWKDPMEVIALKRIADRLFYVNAPLFSKSLSEKYKSFIELCFIPKPPDEFDANTILKTDVHIRKNMYMKASLAWDPKWDSNFAPPNKVASRDKIAKGYTSLVNSFVSELGVRLK